MCASATRVLSRPPETTPLKRTDQDHTAASCGRNALCAHVLCTSPGEAGVMDVGDRGPASGEGRRVASNQQEPGSSMASSPEAES